MCETTETDYADNEEKLISNMKAAVSDVEEIVRETSGIAGGKIGELRERITEKLCDAKVCIAEAEEHVITRTKAAARATDHYVNENPWRSAGIAAGVGLLLGIIIGRR
ncbi:MAG: DUF883 family protein [Candidatus Accumulibacter sp.]|jgi:ElaB/YqjD/DUF883 family membrane-anchored ribosome-binding protein|nr:DUF883 family protein [Accumulibacter sp.]